MCYELYNHGIPLWLQIIYLLPRNCTISQCSSKNYMLCFSILIWYLKWLHFFLIIKSMMLSTTELDWQNLRLGILPLPCKNIWYATKIVSKRCIFIWYFLQNQKFKKILRPADPFSLGTSPPCCSGWHCMPPGICGHSQL